MFFFPVKGLLQFTLPYSGTSVRGSVGSSVNFTWGFSSNVGAINWGLRKSGANGFETNGVLVTISRAGQVLLSGPPAYTGRVSGSRSSGQAIFTLTSISKADERVYGCRLEPRRGSFDSFQFDSVQLVVEGKVSFLPGTVFLYTN